MRLHLNLFGLPGTLSARRKAQRLSPAQRAALEEDVENVVDGIEPKIRLVRGYQKKLQPAVTTARAYIDALVEKIPGPLQVSPKAFVSDPYVNAFFATPQEVRAVFSHSAELKAFFDQPSNADVDSACALLCMVEQEKDVLGMELAHGAIRRDVRQTVVNFSEHKVLSPATTEAEARRGLKNCIFSALVSHALRHIADLKAQKQELQDQRRILYARLRARHAYSNGLTTLLSVVPADQAGTRAIEAKLAVAEEELRHMPATRDAPRDYLQEVKAILERPQAFIQLKRVSFQLTRMSIKADAASPQPTNTVELAEIEITNVLKRVVLIVRYPRAEMLPEQDAAGTLSPHLML